MFKYFWLFAAIIGTTIVSAQTPEQLEMLRRRQEQTTQEQPVEPASARVPTRLDNETARAALESRQMAQQRMENENKLVVSTDKFKILESATGMKLCTLDLELTNYTQYPVEEIQIFFSWGEVETYANFSGLAYEQSATLSVGLAGSVCGRITEDPQLRTTVCRLQGASESFCQSAVIFDQG